MRTFPRECSLTLCITESEYVVHFLAVGHIHIKLLLVQHRMRIGSLVFRTQEMVKYLSVSYLYVWRYAALSSENSEVVFYKLITQYF